MVVASPASDRVTEAAESIRQTLQDAAPRLGAAVAILLVG